MRFFPAHAREWVGKGRVSRKHASKREVLFESTDPPCVPTGADPSYGTASAAAVHTVYRTVYNIGGIGWADGSRVPVGFDMPVFTHAMLSLL